MIRFAVVLLALAGCLQGSEDFRVVVTFESQADEEAWVEAHVRVPADGRFRETTVDCGDRQRLATRDVTVSCWVPRPTQPFDPEAAPSADAYYVVEVVSFASAQAVNDIDGSQVEVHQAPAPGATVRFQATYGADGILTVQRQPSTP